MLKSLWLLLYIFVTAIHVGALTTGQVMLLLHCHYSDVFTFHLHMARKEYRYIALLTAPSCGRFLHYNLEDEQHYMMTGTVRKDLWQNFINLTLRDPKLLRNRPVCKVS